MPRLLLFQAALAFKFDILVHELSKPDVIELTPGGTMTMLSHSTAEVIIWHKYNDHAASMSIDKHYRLSIIVLLTQISIPLQVKGGT